MGRLSHGSETLHASAVAFGPAALLLTGHSGSGKSTLALQLVGFGASLVADDRVVATPREGGLWLSPPDAIRDRIEARHFGLLTCPATSAWARAVVDLDRTETDRLPIARETVIAGVRLPAFRKVESPAFPTMLMLYLKGGLLS